MKKGFKLGLAPTRRFCFSVEDAHRYKALTERKLDDLGIEYVNIDSVNEEGLLIRMEDAHKAIALFKAEDVDAVFVPHVNFGTEEVVATLCRALGKPVLLWGPRDEAPLDDGIRLRDSQCGVFATSNVLQKYGVQFTYIVSSRMDDPILREGILTFVAAASVVKAFIGARIGQISTRPPNFYTVIINEQDLLTRWGIELMPLTALRFTNEVRRIAREDPRIPQEVESIAQNIAVRDTPKDALPLIAGMKLFMLDWAREANLSAIAIRCHEDLPEELKCYSCYANALVTDAGIPVACETDIHGALSSLLIQAANLNTEAAFFADLTIRHPNNDNGVLLWHCGNFPPCLQAKGCDAFLAGHCNVAPGYPGTGNFAIDAQDLTVCRFDGINGRYKLFIGEGTATSGPFCLGTYVWMEVADWPLWEEKLVYGPYVHHVAGVRGKCAAALLEACRYISGLAADVATPTEQQIRARLRGSMC